MCPIMVVVSYRYPDPLPDESDLTFADLQQTASADNPSDSISSSTRPNAARSADDFGDDTDLVNTVHFSVFCQCSVVSSRCIVILSLHRCP